MPYAKRVMMVAPTATAEFEILRYCLGGAPAVNIGVFLLDLTKGNLYWKLRRDWASFATEKAAQYLFRLEQALREAQDKMGAVGVMLYLGGCLSNELQLSERESIVTDDPAATLQKIFAERIQSQF